MRRVNIDDALFRDDLMHTADTPLAQQQHVRMKLAKRDCVSDCPTPSCATLSCSSNQICVLTAQTCDACPQVSCQSLDSGTFEGVRSPNSASSSTSSNSSNAGVKNFPTGAVASTTVLGILLLAGLISFGLWRVRRRRAAAEEATAREAKQATGADDDEDDLDDSDHNVCIRLDVEKPAASVSIQSLPIHLEQDNDLVFGADEMMRMSYASRASSLPVPRTTSAFMRGSSTTLESDSEAAIIQANNRVMGVRAKANVVQLRKPSASTTSLSSTVRRLPTAHEEPRQSDVALSRPATKSSGLANVQGPEDNFFEIDTESIIDSPIQRDFFTPRSSIAPSIPESQSNRQQEQRTSVQMPLPPVPVLTPMSALRFTDETQRR
ncbi:hypothetical protein PYCC9005_001684 [Savitreella phatthalungensis]